MSDEGKDRAIALMSAHIDTAHNVLEGLETTIDARALAAVYLARCARIMATLRVRGITDQGEIEACAEQFAIQAMDDSKAGEVKDDDGREILSTGEKAKVH